MSGVIGRVYALLYKSYVCAVVDTTSMLTSWLPEPAIEIEVLLI